MKIYAGRYHSNPIERFIGKDVWVRCESPTASRPVDLLIKFICPASNYRGHKQAWMISIPYDNYKLALDAFTVQIDFVLTTIEDSYKDPEHDCPRRVVPMIIDDFVIKQPMEVYTSQELEDLVKAALEESNENVELPFDI